MRWVLNDSCHHNCRHSVLVKLVCFLLIEEILSLNKFLPFWCKNIFVERKRKFQLPRQIKHNFIRIHHCLSSFFFKTSAQATQSHFKAYNSCSWKQEKYNTYLYIYLFMPINKIKYEHEKILLQELYKLNITMLF